MEAKSDSRDEEVDDRARELLTLISVASAAYCGTSDRYPATHPDLRHVSPNRIFEILSSINLKSILFSPLRVDEGTFAVSRPRLLGVHRSFMAGQQDSRSFSERRLDLLIRSMEHRFSIFGHKIWQAEADDFIPAAVFCSLVYKSGKFVVTGADDFLIKIWSVETAQLVATLRGHDAEVCEVQFSPCMRYLVSSCQDDHSIVLWKRADDGIVYNFHRRFVQTDASGKKLKPNYLQFSVASNTEASTPNHLKLITAYMEGLIVVHEIVSDTSIFEFNRLYTQGDRMEIDYFTQLKNSTSECVSLIVSVSKRHVGRMLLMVSMRARGTPKVLEYSFPVPGNVKSKISHIGTAHTTTSFVANDDEAAGSIVFYRDDSKSEYESLVLLRGQPSGDAVIGADGSLLSSRIGVRTTRTLVFSVIETIFTKNDELILASVCGLPRNANSIGEDDHDKVYCILAFSTAGPGALVGVVGSGVCGDQIFSMGLLDTPFTNTHYMYYASYDGSLTISKLRLTASGHFISEELTRFNLNTDHGTNIPRSILDCQAVVTDSGDIVIVVADALGAVSVFSTDNSVKHTNVPSEQFFLNDYLPLGTPVDFASRPVGIERERTRVTTKASGGIICDSRLIPLSQLSNPSPPIVGPVVGSQFKSRFDRPDPPLVHRFAVNSQSKKESYVKPEEIDLAAPVVQDEPARGRGRPRLTDEERERRAARQERLQSLAAARAAMAADESDEYVRTASGRVVRRINSNRRIPESELDLYENSEIDDSTFDSDESESSSSNFSGNRRRSTRIRANGTSPGQTERRGRGRPRLRPPSPPAPTRMVVHRSRSPRGRARAADNQPEPDYDPAEYARTSSGRLVRRINVIRRIQESESDEESESEESISDSEESELSPTRSSQTRRIMTRASANRASRVRPAPRGRGRPPRR